MNGLNPRQETFAQLLATKRLSASQAYSEAYKRPKDETATVNASRLLANANVAERVEEIEMDMQDMYKKEAFTAFQVQKELMLDNTVPANVRLQAARDFQDRGGFSSTHRIESTKKIEYGKAELSESERDEVNRLLKQV